MFWYMFQGTACQLSNWTNHIKLFWKLVYILACQIFRKAARFWKQITHSLISEQLVSDQITTSCALFAVYRWIWKICRSMLVGSMNIKFLIACAKQQTIWDINSVDAKQLKQRLKKWKYSFTRIGRTINLLNFAIIFRSKTCLTKVESCEKSQNLTRSFFAWQDCNHYLLAQQMWWR